MQRTRLEIKSALTTKGFVRANGDHDFMIYFTKEGKRTALRTKVSHGGGGKSVGDPLLAQMARQCGLTKKGFIDLVDCPMSRDAYEKLLEDSERL